MCRTPSEQVNTRNGKSSSINARGAPKWLFYVYMIHLAGFCLFITGRIIFQPTFLFSLSSLRSSEQTFSTNYRRYSIPLFGNYLYNIVILKGFILPAIVLLVQPKFNFCHNHISIIICFSRYKSP